MNAAESSYEFLWHVNFLSAVVAVNNDEETCLRAGADSDDAHFLHPRRGLRLALSRAQVGRCGSIKTSIWGIGWKVSEEGGTCKIHALLGLLCLGGVHVGSPRTSSRKTPS